MLVDPADHAGQNLLMLVEQCLMRGFAGRVSTVQRDVARFRIDVNLPLHQDKEIGLDAEMRAGHGFHQARQLAAGIDDPPDSLPLQIADQILELIRHGRALKLG